MLRIVCIPPAGTLKLPVNGPPGPVPQLYVPVNAAGRVAPSGFDTVLVILNDPRSRVIELCTVMVKVPPVEPINIDAGSYVGVAHVKPVIGVGATSLTEHTLPVGTPVLVALPPDGITLWPVDGVPSVSSPQS